MRNLLQHLENNEAVLLMYLADELPAEDRAEVEQLLASDEGMRSALSTLRAADGHMTMAFSEADGLLLPPATEAARRSVAVRRMSRAMVRFHVDRDQQIALDEARKPSRSLNLPRWSYPFAAAAIILIAWVGYWGTTVSDSGIVSTGDHKHLQESGVKKLHLLDRQQDLMARDSEEDESAPLLAVQQGDRDLLAISAGVYDVSSMYETEHE